jgi:RNA polymerase sigma-70 factor (ECF subfamily)
MTRTDFDNLVLSISRRLYAYAFRMLGNRQGSEDAVQDVFLKLWKMNQTLETNGSIEALAITMVKNKCLDQLRRMKLAGADEIESINPRSDPAPSPQEKMEREETMRLLDRLINELPQNYRETVKFRDIDELSYGEISEKTGQNINTIRVNLSRARKIIRDKYNKYRNEHR